MLPFFSSSVYRTGGAAVGISVCRRSFRGAAAAACCSASPSRLFCTSSPLLVQHPTDARGGYINNGGGQYDSRGGGSSSNHYGGGRRQRGGGRESQQGQQHQQQQQHRRGRGPVKDRYPPACTDLSDPRRRLALLVDGSNTNLLHRPPGADVGESAFFRTVLPQVLRLGVPVLCRVFAHTLPDDWETLILGGQQRSSASSVPSSSPAAASSSPLAGSNGAPVPLTTLRVPLLDAEGSGPAKAVDVPLQLEYFRVEKFLPIPMQIQADAQHIHDFRNANKIEGVCYCCHEVDREVYSRILDELGDGRGLLSTYYSSSDSVTNAGAPPFFNQYLLDELGLVQERCVDQRSADGS